MLSDLPRLRAGRSGRFSSWDTSGRNDDAWTIAPGETRVLADIRGPGAITHIWMTQRNHYRECLLRITWDNAAQPSVLVPLGDFFGLGHGIVNSYQSLLFTASTRDNNQFNRAAPSTATRRCRSASGRWSSWSTRAARRTASTSTSTTRSSAGGPRG